MAIDKISLALSGEIPQPVGLAFRALQGHLDTLVSQINRALGGEAVGAGAAYTAGAQDAGRVILLDTAAGSVVTLPAATGSKSAFRFMVSVVATSNSHKIQVASADDIMQGLVFTVSDDTNAVLGWRTAADSDTITLDGSTMGSVERGEMITLVDAAAGLWLVNGFTASTGTEASPFSSGVS